MRDMFLAALKWSNPTRAVIVIITFVLGNCIGWSVSIFVGGMNAYDIYKNGWTVDRWEAAQFFVLYSPIFVITVLISAVFYWTLLTWFRKFHKDQDVIHGIDWWATVIVTFVAVTQLLLWIIYMIAVLVKAE